MGSSVVDNNSTDDTPEWCPDWREGSITVRYEKEAEQGLTTPATAASGIEFDHFSYVDDDILVSQDWLFALFDALERNDADAVAAAFIWIRPPGCPRGFARKPT